jgi:hypothetical protein
MMGGWMTMTAIRPRGVARWAVVMSLLLSGCAMGRSSLSIDSNSRAPWLGLEFLPSKKEAPPNYSRSVKQQKSRGKDQVAITPATQSPKKERSLPNWLKPGSEKTPLPLPRTDVVPTADESAGASEAADQAHPDWWDF